ncbi:Uncharacterized protein TCM_039751 [Theobroma cacao]|uniref:Uncharacterized protein n=1 Tax=Theobroma cacao TaxID=3641 RepID=A0A061GYH9_THECC|nr:Uncharacterized protein TCM_039751 [Theobroma cacao]
MSKHVIHNEFGKINLAIVFDVEKEPKILLGNRGVVGAVKADGVSDNEVEDTIKETEPRATRDASIVKWRINKGRAKVAIIKNISKIILKGFNLKDAINKCTGDKNTFAHDMSDKPIVMGD